MAIAKDATRQVPTEWTDQRIRELFEHARDLSHNGNPAGFLLTVDWTPWVTGEYCGKRYQCMADEWDYDAIRQWIAAHPEHVQDVWQLTVRSL